MKIIVITGASEGICTEMARQLAGRHGAEVGCVLATKDPLRLEQVASWLKLLAPARVQAMARAALKEEVKPS